MNEQGVAHSARAAEVRQEARHVLFLSHAGVDAEAALRLADRIEATPEAREHGLKVWVDKRDLEAGSGWQQQLEQAIEERSTAFAVYLGATGIINWVDSEVRVALSRARERPKLPLHPDHQRQRRGQRRSAGVRPAISGRARRREPARGAGEADPRRHRRGGGASRCSWWISHSQVCAPSTRSRHTCSSAARPRPRSWSRSSGASRS